MSARRWQARRLRRPGVRGLEVWNHVGAAGELWRQVTSERVARIAADHVPRQLWASVLMEDLAPAIRELAERYDASAVHLSGGLTALPRFDWEVARRSWKVPVHVAEHGIWGGVAAGLGVLAEEGGGCLVADVGQTSAKAAGLGGCVRLRRNLQLLPRQYIGTPPPDGNERARRLDEFCRFVAGAMAAAAGEAAAACDRVLLALPCPIDDGLVPGLSTYGVDEDGELVHRILDAFDALVGPTSAGEREALVTNDAELAAEGARQLGLDGTVLCMTLGFGPGGALLEPR